MFNVYVGIRIHLFSRVRAEFGVGFYVISYALTDVVPLFADETGISVLLCCVSIICYSVELNGSGGAQHEGEHGGGSGGAGEADHGWSRSGVALH